jgi:hypothetical protein
MTRTVVEVVTLNGAPVASFHLIRETTSAANLPRLAVERRALARVDGLTLWRLGGTGAGSSTANSRDLRRRAVFALWRDEAALETFLSHDLLAQRWQRADECWHVRLLGAGGHGHWHGVDVPTVLGTGQFDTGQFKAAGPVAIITRANVHLRQWRAFSAARPAVDRELHNAAGLIDVVGFGEAPIGRQATFSLWSSIEAARVFAYAQPRHRDVIERTHNEQWYGEEMFARFVPYASSGSWDGRDPLSAAR